MLPEVKEAIRRLPKNVAEERQFRMSRALYLSMRKEILPQNEWTNFEEVSVFIKRQFYLIFFLDKIAQIFTLLSAKFF